MEESELITFLRQNPSKGLEILLEDKPQNISQGGMQTVDYWLNYTSNDPEYAEKQFLENMGPERLGNGAKCHHLYNLDRLATEMKARLPAKEQLRIMKAVLDRIAEIDPRIKGEDSEPIAQITKVGGKSYNLEFMREFYAYVQHEFHERGLDKQKL